MNSEFFIPQSPVNVYANEDLSEEELYQNIFSLKLDTKEIINGADLDNLYYLNNKSKKNEKTKKEESIQKEDDLNSILLIDDYDLIFNKLETNKKEEEEKNEIKVQNINENYKMEDNNLPCFANNFISENKYFHFIENEIDDLFIKIDEPIEIEKTEKVKEKKNGKEKDFEAINMQNQKLKKTKKRKKSPNTASNKPIPNSNSKTKPKKKRGPYKKDVKIIQQVNTEDKYFPFNTGKGLFNSQKQILQENPYICSIDFSEINYSENSEMIKDNYNYLEYEIGNKNVEEEKKVVEENKSQNEHILCPNNLCLKFSTKKYFIAENGKKKKS